MDISVLRSNSADAFKYYKTDDKKFNHAMGNFYREGVKNPSVARLIFKDENKKHIEKLQKVQVEFLRNASQIQSPSCDTFSKIPTEKASLYYATVMLKSILNTKNIENDEKLNSIPEKKVFDKKYQELYPRTGALRKRIIEAGQVVPDKVMPKTSWAEKMMNLRTVGELKEKYPKTFLVRTKLIMDGQFNQDRVKPRIKGFFNRLSYKTLFKAASKLAK